jgi:hypothetical protein
VPLPVQTRVGAFVLGTLSDGGRSIGFPVVAQAARSPDGRGLNVDVCTRRPGDRRGTRPGRYVGRVRVAGPLVNSVDVPVEATIKAARTENVLFAILVAVLGAYLGAANSKPAEVDATKVKQRPKLHLLLSLLPFVAGVMAGLVAALAVYADDPTFGAHRGTDTAKLLTATFAAATGGLTVTAPASRGLRRRLAS